MEVRSGSIFRSPEINIEESRKRLIQLSEEQYQEMSPLSKNKRKNVMRNKPCICGSNKKFKKCCWNKYR